ncbi:hypothetical protein [Luteimonas fraxinea]|uniref:Outer membrane protein assembly factor BamE n=1 Tax=Luteimonas fraxinea TaxID=2901869 RepID=A0ABS8UEC5_9GAMM|nr:hypothetical protein [Luteimonas fraxinea]MCD9097069.1 hypothetical protein [Luteimonas fraxinea]
MRPQLFALIFAAALSSCASMESGRAIPDGAADSMVVGTTTERDVRAALGAPQSETVNADGSKVLVYVHMRSRSNGFTASGDANTLALVFDAAGVLQRKSTQNTDTRSR